MVHGLDHVRVESGLARLLAVFRLSPPRERDQHQILTPWFLPDAPADFIAIHPRQTDIEQHDVGPDSAGSLEGGHAVVCLMRLMAGQVQQHGKRFRPVLAVVDDQDPAGYGRSRFLGRRCRGRHGRHGGERQANGELAPAPESFAPNLHCRAVLSAALSNPAAGTRTFASETMPLASICTSTSTTPGAIVPGG